MKKETLTLENIKKDLHRVAFNTLSNQEEMRMVYIIPLTIGAIFLGILFNNLLIGLLVFSGVPYHLYYYVIEHKEYKTTQEALMRALDRCNISIDAVKLERVTKETIYEPHYVGLGHCGRKLATKEITVFYFEAGNRWRVPNVLKHYRWSKEFHLSRQGLENISVEGNEFFYISLQGYPDVVYVYPCKFFELSEELKKRRNP